MLTILLLNVDSVSPATSISERCATSQNRKISQKLEPSPAQ